MECELIDTHSHVADAEFDDERDEVIKRAIDSGVKTIFTIGSDFETSRRCVELSNDRPFIYAAVGHHPHEAKKFDESKIEDFFSKWIKYDRVCALGEIGLDYHYTNSSKEIQMSIFSKQLEWASEWGIPVIIHSREADEDTLKILDGYRTKLPDILIHCFTGSVHFLLECIKRDFYISFSGIVTFKNSDGLRAMIGRVPIDRIMIETDSPYLAPVPHRGERNEPAYIVHTARCVAGVLKMPLIDFSNRLKENVARFFRILS